jgi:hypothetical protein
MRMLSAYMIDLALRHKLRVEMADGRVLDNCLELPALDMDGILAEWTILAAGKSEDGSVLMQAVKREVSLLNTVVKQNTEAEV